MLLFVPADRPERVRKAAELADIVVIDLEDAVAPASRASARDALVAIAGELDPARTIVRISAASTSDNLMDIAAILTTPLITCMLAKAESHEDVLAAAPLQVVALVETPLGVINSGSIAAAPGCVGLMWGSEDLAIELGASQSRRDGQLIGVLETARHTTLLAAHAHGRFAIDAAFPDLDDESGLRSESATARGLGFDAKACIHPRQIDLVREAFRPSAADAAWAGRVTVAAASRPDAVFQLDGEMIDAPVIRRAEAILRLLPPR